MPATLIGLGAILLWAALALLTASTRGVPPFELLGLSFGIAAFAGLALLAVRGRLRLLRQPVGAWALGFGGLFFYHALYFFALKAAPPAPASLIAYLWPLLIVLFAAALPGERLRARHLGGAALGLGGTALLVLAPAAAGQGSAPAAGYAAALGCALVWSGYSVLNRRFAQVPGEMIAGVCLLVAMAALPVHVVLEPSVAPAPGQWLAIVLLGLGPVGLAFYAWDHATKRGNLPVLGALSYLAPLLSTALLIAAGKAPLSATLLAAAGLIIGGAALATFGMGRSAGVGDRRVRASAASRAGEQSRGRPRRARP
jgi:drug/metabolite transporter (DMT)-like permease